MFLETIKLCANKNQAHVKADPGPARRARPRFEKKLRVCFCKF